MHASLTISDFASQSRTLLPELSGETTFSRFLEKIKNVFNLKVVDTRTNEGSGVKKSNICHIVHVIGEFIQNGITKIKEVMIRFSHGKLEFKFVEEENWRLVK